MYFKKLLRCFLNIFKKKKQIKISLLIPFSSNDPIRIANFNWLLKYWKAELPHAEIIIGKSTSKVFCKNEALNNAAKLATGKVLVVLDADAYISGKVINDCADKIILNLDNRLWYVPYRNLYRLTQSKTKCILSSFPETPLRSQSPPLKEDIENQGDSYKYGHRYGAMIMMFPREALLEIGGFDERFNQGWGGEDIALLRALDTLWGKHKTVNTDILHLWHPYIGENFKTRSWEGQDGTNGPLTMRYNLATRKPAEMRKLINEK